MQNMNLQIVKNKIEKKQVIWTIPMERLRYSTVQYLAVGFAR